MQVSNQKQALESVLPLTTLTAISPLDGRYGDRKSLKKLAEIMSEYGLMRYRVQVEASWFVGLSQVGFREFPRLASDEEARLRHFIVEKFSIEDAEAIKLIEVGVPGTTGTNHDVKAVEYWLKKAITRSVCGTPSTTEFVHFACTSEDINSCAHALQLKKARMVLIQSLDRVIKKMLQMARDYASVPMLARTHGQPAVTTTVGKEIANVVVRLRSAIDKISAVKLYAKMNGAVGNYNAHMAAYPEFDWQRFSEKVVESKESDWGLGLNFRAYTTQIEPHDYMAELFDAVARCNTILIDWSRDVWGYISLGYFKQKTKEGEIGSSTMPHKVNPIDFENAEGNFGLANALLRHLSEKLPISRWQRDLTDSTVLRNMGVALGYAVLGYDSLAKGLGKLEINEDKLYADLDGTWEVLSEPLQTVMRRYGLKGGYEQLKDLTRGKELTQRAYQEFVRRLEIPEEERERLLLLTPSTYIGKAAELAIRVNA